MGALIGGWAVGPVVGRRPAGPVREAVHPRSGTRGVLVVVDSRFAAPGQPDHDAVARAAGVGHPAIVPLLDAGILEDGTRWYVAAAPPGPVLDPEAGCSPRRAALIAEGVARALAALHAAGVAHGLVGAQTVVPAAGRHRDGGAGSTLLLDTGIAPLVGAGAARLASASEAVLPEDRGPAADVNALGALLLRMLTTSAPAGTALAALPVGLRALLSEMLEDDPRRRPTAAAVAGRLAGLREGLPATAPVDLPVAQTAPTTAPVPTPASAPVRTQAPAPVRQPAATRPPASAPVRTQPPVSAPVRMQPPAPAAFTSPTPALSPPPTRVAAPVHAPVGLASLGIVPSIRPDSAHAMRTGPIRVVPPATKPKRVRRLLIATGGVGLAALLVGVVTHLPPGQDVGIHAAAAGANDALTGVGAPVGSVDADSVTSATPSTAAAAKRTAAATAAAAAAVAVTTTPSVVRPGATAAPTFLKPTAIVPSPLAAATRSSSTASLTTPRSTSTATTTTTPSSSSSSGSTPTSSDSSTPSGATSTPSETSSGSSSPSESSSSSSSSSDSESSSSSASSTPDSSDTPSATTTPSDTATPSESATSDATDSPSPSATD